jgi:hypothetical protein
MVVIAPASKPTNSKLKSRRVYGRDVEKQVAAGSSGPALADVERDTRV